MVLDDELGEGELAGADGGEVGEEVAAEMEIVLVGFVREDGEIGGAEAVLLRVLGGDGLARLGLLAPAEAAVAAAGFHTPGILFGYSGIGTRLIFHAFRLGGGRGARPDTRRVNDCFEKRNNPRWLVTPRNASGGSQIQARAVPSGDALSKVTWRMAGREIRGVSWLMPSRSGELFLFARGIRRVGCVGVDFRWRSSGSTIPEADAEFPVGRRWWGWFR